MPFLSVSSSHSITHFQYLSSSSINTTNERTGLGLSLSLSLVSYNDWWSLSTSIDTHSFWPLEVKMKANLIPLPHMWKLLAWTWYRIKNRFLLWLSKKFKDTLSQSLLFWVALICFQFFFEWHTSKSPNYTDCFPFLMFQFVYVPIFLLFFNLFCNLF